MSDSRSEAGQRGGCAGFVALFVALAIAVVGGSFFVSSRGPTPSATPTGKPPTKPAKAASVEPPPPQDLPQPYPEPIVVSGGRPFVSGPVNGGKAGVVVDPTRNVVHAMRWPDASLVALDPQTGSEVYVHAKGDAPLAVVGNRLLAQGNTSLWILDTHDGTPVCELPLPMLPPVLERTMSSSYVRVEQVAGDVVVVRIHRDEASPVVEGSRTRWEHEVEDYAFALDVGTGRVVASPADLVPVEVNEVLQEIYFPNRNGTLSAFPQGGEPRANRKPSWKLWLRRLYSPAPKVAPPSPPLPQPWPTPVATGHGRAFEPGPGAFSSSRTGLADPTRGVYHLARSNKDLAAFDPKTGRPVYVHAGGEAPIAVLGNRLLAQSAGTLWILDTHDGAVVYTLESPLFPPLISEGGRAVGVRSWQRAGSVLVVETFWSEPSEPQPGDVERTPATVTRYAFGIDMQTGQISAPPAETEELEKATVVGSYWIEFHNQTARGHSLSGARGESLWDYRMRSLRVQPPIKVEADDR